jgi:hypothetical protein
VPSPAPQECLACAPDPPELRALLRPATDEQTLASLSGTIEGLLGEGELDRAVAAAQAAPAVLRQAAPRAAELEPGAAELGDSADRAAGELAARRGRGATMLNSHDEHRLELVGVLGAMPATANPVATRGAAVRSGGHGASGHGGGSGTGWRHDGPAPARAEAHPAREASGDDPAGTDRTVGSRGHQARRRRAAADPAG